MITTTLVLSVLSAVAATVAAYFLGRSDGVEQTRNRYSRMISNLNSELSDLVDSVRAGTEAAIKEEELNFPAEPEGKGTEITELPKELELPKEAKKKASSSKKAPAATSEMKPKRKKGKK